MERRFHSPYRHWLAGLVFELAVLAGFIVTLGMLAALIAWMAG